METEGMCRVLIADKWATWVKLFSDLLAGNFEVVPVNTLEEAVNRIQSAEPPFHVAVIDIQLTANPDQDLDSGHHTLLDKIRARGSYTSPIIVVSHGPTPRQVDKVLDNYNVSRQFCLEKFPRANEVLDYVRFTRIINQAAKKALAAELKSRVDSGYHQIQELARERFRVLPVFSGEPDPTSCLVLLPSLDTSQSVHKQIKMAISSLEIQQPELKCRCVPHDIEREREEVWSAINGANLIIADLSDKDPDVLYEVGLCDALGKRMLFLIDEGQEVPNHLGIFWQISYAPDQWGIIRLASKLKGELTEGAPLAHPLGESRWSLEEIRTGEVLALLHPTPTEADNLSPEFVTALEDYGSFYQQFVTPVLELMSWETKELEGVFDSRHDAEAAWRVINRTGVILANISPADPEVLYAVGLAHAQNRPVILFTSDKETVPVHLRGLEYFEYSLDWKEDTILRKRDELILRVNQVLNAYNIPEQPPDSQALSEKPPDSDTITPPPSPKPTVPSSSFWDACGWESTDGRYSIPEGVIRDILSGLNDGFPEAELSKIFRDEICALANAREDRRILTAVELWEALWLQEAGLPYLPLIGVLAAQELSGEMYDDYRDHVAHSVWSYFLGLYLYRQHRPVREAVLNHFSETEFLCAWKIAALFHDIGYTCDRGIDEEEGFLKPLLEKLQAFTNLPLVHYLKARGFDLSEEDESHLARISDRYTPRVLTLDSIEFMPLPGAEERSLNQIEALAIPTRLAQKRQNTPLHNYFSLGKNAQPKNRGRFRDHGILSALILLHQFHYLDHCLQILKDITLPERLDRDSFDALSEIISGPVTQNYRKIVRQAAAAMALHNVNVTIWETEEMKKDPYCLSPTDYRIALEESPLAFLLALTDVLQCWDRPKRRFPGGPEEFSIPSHDVRIICEDDNIIWSVRPDSDAKKQLTVPSQEIKTMSTYLAFQEKPDLSSLIKEKKSE